MKSRNVSNLHPLFSSESPTLLNTSDLSALSYRQVLSSTDFGLSFPYILRLDMSLLIGIVSESLDVGIDFAY